MSRSYKKTPRCGEEKNKWAKSYANRSFRRTSRDALLSRGFHKRTFCSYDICDYESVNVTFTKYFDSLVKLWKISGRENGEPFPDMKYEYRKWYKWYKMK